MLYPSPCALIARDGKYQGTMEISCCADCEQASCVWIHQLRLHDAVYQTAGSRNLAVLAVSEFGSFDKAPHMCVSFLVEFPGSI